MLHAFQKKSPHGRETPHVDQDLIRSRLAWARWIDAEHRNEE